MKILFTTGLILGSFAAFSAEVSSISEAALKFIPGGKVVQVKQKEVKIQTSKGSIIEVEFTQAKEFEEASGKSLDRDNFIPDQNLITLEKAIESAKKEGKTPTGEWSLENSFTTGWHYDLEGFENGKAMDYTIDAKTGKLTDVRIDD